MNSQELFVAAGGQKPRGPGSVLCTFEDSETFRGQPGQKFLLFGTSDRLSLIHMSTYHHGEQTPQTNRNSVFPLLTPPRHSSYRPARLTHAVCSWLIIDEKTALTVCGPITYTYPLYTVRYLKRKCESAVHAEFRMITSTAVKSKRLSPDNPI